MRHVKLSNDFHIKVLTFIVKIKVNVEGNYYMAIYVQPIINCITSPFLLLYFAFILFKQRKKRKFEYEHLHYKFFSTKEINKC